jgi:putative hydrolase of the HAD superfamily|tara:strand:+ start:265 stop:888 length:624 start_codon:yes stop_codon:yes gene_type:complete
MIKVIIFDLDDTLYTEHDYVLSGFKFVADFASNKFNISKSQMYDALVESFESRGRGKNFDYALKKLGVDKYNINELVSAYRNHIPHIVLPRKAIKVLRDLKKDYTLCLLTNGWIEAQKRKVEKLELDKYFDSIWYAQEYGVQFRKPNKKYFLKIFSHYKAKPSEVLVIGDNSIEDIQAGENLGCYTHQVKSPGDLQGIKETCKKAVK